MKSTFNERWKALESVHKALVERPNKKVSDYNGIYHRYEHPVLTAAHTPLFWRFDLNPATNPFLMQRFGINSVFNAGAIKFRGKYVLIARVEGWDRKSFFAIAESDNGIDNFHFHDYPLQLPEAGEENVYDMRLVQHEDGWIYGLFCAESRDHTVQETDQSAAIAQCGIARTRDLVLWERLQNLKSTAAQQRNVVLHPEFVDGKYAFYTRPQDGFIQTGKGGGIAFGLSHSIENAAVPIEQVIDHRKYHTVYETKNGLGPAPLKTNKGWLHLAHGVRNTAAGLRYVLYLFMTSLDDITKVIYKPAGYFMAPEGEERVGDVSNVLFSNGWIAEEDGTVLIYYASSDTRIHVATSSIERLLDYVMHTQPDGFRSNTSLEVLNGIITRNLEFTERTEKNLHSTFSGNGKP